METFTRESIMHLMCFFSQVYQFKYHSIKLVNLIDNLKKQGREQGRANLFVKMSLTELNRKKWRISIRVIK